MRAAEKEKKNSFTRGRSARFPASRKFSWQTCRGKIRCETVLRDRGGVILTESINDVMTKESSRTVAVGKCVKRPSGSKRTLLRELKTDRRVFSGKAIS